LKNDDDRIAFHAEFDLTDEDGHGTVVREIVSEDGVKVQQRISLHEIYESTEMTKLIREVEDEAWTLPSSPRVKTSLSSH